MSLTKPINNETRRYAKVIRELTKLYPNPRSELNFSSNYELTIAVILSAQCTDRKVNEVSVKLFAQYPDFNALSRALLEDVEKTLRPVNYYKTKSKNIIALSKLVIKDHAGSIPTSFDQLVSLPGIGRKSANVILGEVGSCKTLPVDTHVFRVSQRLGLAKGKKPEEIEEQLKRKFASKQWRPLHHWLILHGRRICKAQSPLCVECALRLLCPVGKRLK